MATHPSGLFFGILKFGPMEVWPLKFLRALETDPR